MHEFLTELATAFVTLAVVMNVLPILPVVLNIVGEMPDRERRKLTNRALLVGICVGLVIGLFGSDLFRALGVTTQDLQVGGGLVLLVFAIHDLLFSRQRRAEEIPQDLSVVPLGVPLLVGPATMTAVAVLVEAGTTWVVLLAFLLNAGTNWLILRWGPGLVERIGRGFVRALGKVYGLVLVTLAASMIRKGLTGVF